MKTALNLNELAAEITRRAESKKDLVVNTGEGFGYHAADNSLKIYDRGDLVESFSVNDVAHAQIAERVKIPAKYYSRMRADAPELLERNVNHWFRNSPEDRMIRTIDGTARAFLSNRYQRIDNEEVAEMVLPILGEQDSIRIESCAITDTRMYIKAVFPRLEGEVAKGDAVQAGVVISNSEVGFGAVKVEPLIYRLVCLNGMILPDASYKARHVGGAVTIDGVYSVLSDEALKADDHAKLLKVRDVLRATLDEARFNDTLVKMREAAGEKIEGDVVKAVEVLGKKISLNEGERSSVLRHLIEGGDLSRWGLLNAVTRSSQDVEDYDRATELETAGGVILQMPSREFRQIALAA